MGPVSTLVSTIGNRVQSRSYFILMIVAFVTSFGSKDVAQSSLTATHFRPRKTNWVKQQHISFVKLSSPSQDGRSSLTTATQQYSGKPDNVTFLLPLVYWLVHSALKDRQWRLLVFHVELTLLKWLYYTDCQDQQSNIKDPAGCQWTQYNHSKLS